MRGWCRDLCQPLMLMCAFCTGDLSQPIGLEGQRIGRRCFKRGGDDRQRVFSEADKE